MPPEIIGSKERRADKSVPVIFHSILNNRLSFYCEHQASGWEFGGSVIGNLFLETIRKAARFEEPPSEEDQKDVINSLSYQLERRTSGEEKAIRFSPEELIGVQRESRFNGDSFTLRFASQKTVNETFLKLLPLGNYDAEGLKTTLKTLRMFDNAVLDRIEAQVARNGKGYYIVAEARRLLLVMSNIK